MPEGVKVATKHIASSPRFLLRDMTASDHARAEAVHYQDQKFADQEAYFRYLACLYRAHKELGSAAAKQRNDPEEHAHHNQCAALICSDLGQRLGSATTVIQLSEDQAWGVSYALIGSALGATTILRAMHEQVDWPIDYLKATVAFAKSKGVAQFFGDLNAAAPEPDQAAAGARLVFDIIAARQHLAAH